MKISAVVIFIYCIYFSKDTFWNVRNASIFSNCTTKKQQNHAQSVIRKTLLTTKTKTLKFIDNIICNLTIYNMHEGQGQRKHASSSLTDFAKVSYCLFMTTSNYKKRSASHYRNRLIKELVNITQVNTKLKGKGAQSRDSKLQNC